MTSRPAPHILPALLQHVRAWRRHRGGGVAIVFGFALLPLAMAVGAALDYSRASAIKSSLDRAADAAVLSAVTPGAMTLPGNKAKKNAEAFFTEQAAGVTSASDVDVTVNVVDTATTRTAQISYTAKGPVSLLKVAGWSGVPIKGDAKAASAPPVYIDFHVLLDNSPSMGVAATTADITEMMSRTPDGCAFACHDLSSGGNDYYALAKKKIGGKTVTMRIDVVRDATQQLMDTAKDMATVSGQYRAALYTLGASCTAPILTTVSALTSNLSAAKKNADDIDLMSIPFQNYNNDQCTHFDATFTALNAVVPASGSGGTSASPQRIVMFVSDGVADAAAVICSKPTTGGRCQEPIKLANCQALKDRGIKVAVLYTTYLPLPTNDWYNTWIAPFASSISPRMESCASPGLYFEVGPNQGIADAMAALFKRSVATARLSE